MANRTPVEKTGTQNTQPNEPVYDQRGIEVRIGDTLAIGSRIGNSGELKVGVVTGFGTRNEPVYIYETDPVSGRPIRARVDFTVTVQVDYVSSSGYGRQKGYVRAYDRKFVVVGEATA